MLDGTCCAGLEEVVGEGIEKENTDSGVVGFEEIGWKGELENRIKTTVGEE